VCIRVVRDLLFSGWSAFASEKSEPATRSSSYRFSRATQRDVPFIQRSSNNERNDVNVNESPRMTIGAVFYATN
jgi:hypothetical protein